LHPLAHGVFHAEQPNPGVAGVGFHLPIAAVGQSQEPQAFPGPLIHPSQVALLLFGGRVTHPEDNLRRSFQKVVALALEHIARDLGDHVFRFAGEHFLGQPLGVVEQILRAVRHLLLGIFPQGDVYRTLQVVAQHHGLVGALCVEEIGPAHPHPALGKCAGLVGADHRHRAERFDCQQPFHQAIACEDLAHAQHQDDRHRDQQPFRHSSDGQDDRRAQHVEELAAHEQPNQQDHHSGGDHDIRQDPAKGFEPHLERRIFLDVLAQAGRNLPQLGMRASAGDTHDSPPGDNRCAHEDLCLWVCRVP